MGESSTKQSLSKDVGVFLDRLRSVLVPVDLTPSSDRILGRVALLPFADGARITIVHVVPGSLLPNERRDAERYAQKVLVSEAQHLRKLLPKNVSIQPLVLTGSTAKELSACAAKVKANLIVMGRGGGRAMRDAFLGSTAERVVREAQVPVLVVRIAPRASYSRPALALDLDQAAREIVRLMLLVLPPPRPHVTVIHAYDIPYAGMIYPSLAHEEADEVKDALYQKATHELTSRLTRAVSQLNVAAKDAPSWKAHVKYGSPRMVVEKAIKKADTDLLVLGTRAYSGAAYVFLGTIAGEILRAATCDVLMVPPSRSAEAK